MRLKKMLLNWLLKPFKSIRVVKPFLPDNTRVYCIGDIHGRDDLLAELLTKIELDYRFFKGQIIIIFLGDFIDRGDCSKQVIDRILSHEKPSVKYIYLRGNHEQTLLECLQTPNLIPSWLSFGGQATLASYQVTIDHILTNSEEFALIQQQFKNNLPREHYEFFIKTRLCYSLGGYFFVHAGIYPKRDLEEQYSEDMLWIREKFTACKKNYAKIIVHGHTITSTPQLLKNRIGIDTGAYMSGILTCLVLEADQQRFLQTNGRL
jgi:serine/threonine protein phosphatase 1